MDISKLGFYQTDCETILSHLKHHDHLLQLKRRWLMGFSISKSEKEKLFSHRSLPESFLREDDIFYDTVKVHVEEAFGVNEGESDDNIIQETKRLFDRYGLKGLILSSLDTLTNKGLFFLALLLTRGLVVFEKTRPKMKKVIKEAVPAFARDCNHEVQIEILTQLSQLLKDPQNVRENCLTLMFPTFRLHHAFAIKILDKLEDLTTETLLAMRRKLRGDPAGTPCLQQTRFKLTRDELIFKVRRKGEEMLAESRGDELQEPLAKALAVASLSVKLTGGYSNSSTLNFYQFSPKIKALQNEIARALWLLKSKTKVRIQELQTLQLLLDPNANVTNASLRTAMKKLFTEYLFECDDMDIIPKSLSKALAIINRHSQSAPSGCSLKDEIEEEVDCILNLSAQIKQIIWDLLPDHDFDGDFTNVYMEELEESDDGGDDNYDDHDTDHVVSGDDDAQQIKPRNIHSRSCSTDMNNLEESCGEYIPVNSEPSISNFEGHRGHSLYQEKNNVDRMPNMDATQFTIENMGKFGSSKINGSDSTSYLPDTESLENIHVKGNKSEQNATVDSEGPPSSSFCSKGKKFMSNGNNASTNLFLGIQEVCDETSVVAYDLIGYMMEKFAKEEGFDLDRSDNTYLRGDKSNQENQVAEERQTTTERNVADSVIVQGVEELLPSLPKSGMEKLKELIGIL